MYTTCSSFLNANCYGNKSAAQLIAPGPWKVDIGKQTVQHPLLKLLRAAGEYHWGVPLGSAAGKCSWEVYITH
jgi:hypothetical protein